MGVAVSRLYVWPGATAAPVLRGGGVAESLSGLDATITLGRTLGPSRPRRPPSIYWLNKINSHKIIDLSTFTMLYTFPVLQQIQWSYCWGTQRRMCLCTWTVFSVTGFLLLALSVTGRRVCVWLSLEYKAIHLCSASVVVVAANVAAPPEPHVVHVMEACLAALWPGRQAVSL